LFPDKRLKQVISDALQWAQDHPNVIQYNASSDEDLFQIAPNLIGFQLVMWGLASRLRKTKNIASRITVDQQIEFNKAQQALASLYLKFPNNIPIQMGCGLPDMNFKGMPTIPITISNSKDSAGLELVDIFLWIFKRYSESKKLSPALSLIIRSQLYRGNTDELSLRAVFNKWKEWYDNSPVVTEENLKIAQELLKKEEERRLKAVKKF
jgi:hypothetical protein